MKEGEVMRQWVVYYIPGTVVLARYCARLWEISHDGRMTATQTIRTANTLKEVRAKLPAGLYPLARDPSDDPAILEVWL